MSRLNAQDIRQALFYPIKALTSKDFYFSALFRMRGTGILYLFVLSLVLAIPAAWRSMAVLDFFNALEIPKLVAQIPSSYLDQSGTLSANDENESYKLIYSSKGVPAVVYNPEGRTLEGDALRAPVEFLSQCVRVTTEKGNTEIPYTGFFEGGSNFNPVETAQAAEMILNANFQMVWSAMVLWFFVLLLCNSFICACLGRFMMLFVFRIRMKFLSALRLCSFANTIVAAMILAQFYIYLPLSYTLMILLPMLYIAAFARAFRRELAQSGLEVFKAKYSKMRAEAQAAREGRAAPADFEAQPQNHDGNGPSKPEDRHDDHRGGGYFEA